MNQEIDDMYFQYNILYLDHASVSSFFFFFLLSVLLQLLKLVKLVVKCKLLFQNLM